jgi:LmbE family N-acetylglucosaminyl deacetylase
MGLRVIDVQNNRGDGGQNEIGPVLFRDMGVLRTAELLAAHRIDGAEQYFTRAIDYGYSFDPNEVIGKWGREEIVGDYVRLFRTLRPDIVVTMNIQGGGGDRAHEAQTILVREAYGLSGDPTKYPEQLSQGLRPWKPYKVYFSGTQVTARGHRARAERRRRRWRWCSRRRGGCARRAVARRSHRHVGVRRAARPHLSGDRDRRAQQSQVSGNGRPAWSAGNRRRPRRRLWWTRRARRWRRTGRIGG